MPYVTSIERLAKEEGREEGQLQGRQEMSSMVTRQLKRRIGTMSPELEQQIDQLSFEQLGELGEALLDFKDEAALKNWLATH